MITQGFLSQRSDEQINKGVAWCRVKEFSLMTKGDKNEIDYWAAIDIFNRIEYEIDNYCTNPNDIMPIAFDNKFLIEPPNFFTDNWTVTSFYIIENIGERSIKVTNKNPLRAICEVYILMSVNK